MTKQRSKASAGNLMWNKEWEWKSEEEIVMERWWTIVPSLPPFLYGAPGASIPSACHSGGDWGGGEGGRGEEGSQCWPGRDCPGCVAPSPSSPAPLDPRTDGCSAAGSSSSIAGCCRCLCSHQTSQLCPWGKNARVRSGRLHEKLEMSPAERNQVVLWQLYWK